MIAGVAFVLGAIDLVLLAILTAACREMAAILAELVEERR